MEGMTIGQRIASRRKLSNLSQENLSEQLGVSRQAISKWESDAGLPDIDNLIALSKIFGVSVGWLLGTEQDPNFDPSTGLSDAQLRMVEELVSKRRPKRRLIWLNIALAAVIVAQSVIFTLQLSKSKQENDLAQQHISALKQQVDDINMTLVQQDKENDILLNVFTKAYLNDDEQNVTIDFYFIPKLYQDNAQAYITILNKDNPYKEKIQLDCHRVGEFYACRTELPAKNGYQYSFFLAGESGFREQKLDDGIFVYLKDLYDATRYHLASEGQMREAWNLQETLYTFNQPIGSPLIGFLNGYVGYEAIDVTLYHNDTPIHTDSLREAFRDHGGPYMVSEEPLIPDIKIQLPVLSVGDTLKLEISAKSYNGKNLSNVLEELRVVDTQNENDN